MERYKVSSNFYLDEFINPSCYKQFGLRSSRYLRPELIKAAQLFRDITEQSVTINDWLVGGSYKNSGLRQHNVSIGAKYSMHKFGCAIDIKCGSMDSFDMFNVLVDEWAYFYELGIRRVEHPNYTIGKHRSWLHIDMANDFSNLTEEPVIIKP